MSVVGRPFLVGRPLPLVGPKGFEPLRHLLDAQPKIADFLLLMEHARR